jgi:CheY-like chemotaxis protein
MGILKPSALILEDDPDVAELYSHLMHLLGFAPEVCSSRQEAWAWLRGHVPGLVILDLRLNGEYTGVDFLDRIREDDRLIDTLVIVISGYPRMTEGLREKADLILHKPIDVRQLAGLIQRLQFRTPNLLPADFDPLDTRLLGEDDFIERIGYNLARTRKQEAWFAVIAVRLHRSTPADGLPEEIENRLQHEAARRLQRRLRLVDQTTRTTAGEFIVMLYEIREPENAAQIAGRLTGVLSQPFTYDGIEIVHRAHAGVAVSSPLAAGPTVLIERAQSAAADAEKAGRSVVVAPETEQEP